MRTLLCSSYRYGMTVTVILIIWDIHVSGADVIGIQHAEVGDPAHRQMLWPLRLTKYPRKMLCGCPAAAGQGIDGDGGEQDNRGPHVLGGGTEAEQLKAIVDDGDDDPAEDRAQHLAAAAEQAGPADDRGGDRVQDVLAALDVGR